MSPILKAVSALLLFAIPLSLAAAAEFLQVEIEGVSGAIKENVLSALTIYQERKRAEMDAARVRRLHEQAQEEIRTALEPFGFYRPKIRADLTRTQEGWLARYRIVPGEPIKLTRVDVNVTGPGAGDPEFQKLLASFPLGTGSVLNHEIYEQAKRGFQKLAAERGYFDMRLPKHEIRVDLAAYDAELILHIDTGPRYHFGRVIVEQKILDPDLVNRYIPLREGEPYSSARLLEVQAALSDSGYFSRVDVDADPKRAEGLEIPVRVTLAARKSSRYTFGIGYGTDTGPRASIGWERRYLNERGHHMNADLRVSKIRNSLTTNYIIPIRDPRTDQVAFTGGFVSEDTDSAKTDIRLVALSRAVARGQWRETASLTLQQEDSTIAGESVKSTLLFPGIDYVRVWADDRIYTRRGGRIRIDLRGTSESLGSDTGFVQGRLQGKYIRPVGGRGRFILRTEVGATQVSDFDALPASIRFFAGGDQSVRGYGFNTLGPENASGDVVGGTRLLVGSAEYELRVKGNWSTAVFYDVGNALDRFSDPLKRGAGLGVRWKSPVGQIRVDLAAALSEPDRPLRLHINIGPDL